MFPTGATVFSRWYEFGMAIHKYDRGTRSMTHNEIINAVATDKNFSAKNVKRGYEMVKYINKHCPPEIQDNQPKIHTWLKSLTTN